MFRLHTEKVLGILAVHNIPHVFFERVIVLFTWSEIDEIFSVYSSQVALWLDPDTILLEVEASQFCFRLELPIERLSSDRKRLQPSAKQPKKQYRRSYAIRNFSSCDDHLMPIENDQPLLIACFDCP